MIDRVLVLCLGISSFLSRRHLLIFTSQLQHPMARFWEFQQLSDEWRGTSFFDEVPRISSEKSGRGRLFIGGLAALYKEPNPLKSNKITHVLSVLDFEIGDAEKEWEKDGVKHLHVRLEDSPDENLLKWFERTNGFIDEGVEGGGKSCRV